MAIDTEHGTMTGDEMVAITKRHTLFEWSAQSKVDPIPVAGAKGCYFWTPEGKRYLDFNSQLMCTNIGHGHPKVIAAIQRQAEQHHFTPGGYDAQYEPIAIDGDIVVTHGRTRFVDVETGAMRGEFDNVWILRFTPDGRCAEFHEWYAGRPEHDPSRA
jgi:4-aminobutyrate aminotransferase-like enzyme